MKNRLTNFCTLLLLFVVNSLVAQNATLKGNLYDPGLKEPIIGATVQVGTNGTSSDFNGNYSLSLPAGTHKVIFTYTGFETQIQTVTLAAGEEKILDIKMKEGATILKTATVTTSRNEKPLGEVTVSLEVLKPGLINSTNSTSVDQALEKVPGVTIIDGQANIRGGSGYSYGAGSRVLLLSDDIPVLQADSGFPNWEFVPVENIAQVEVVKGAASALYGSSALNGIINIRTAYPTSTPYTRVSAFGTGYTRPRDKQKKWWGPENDTTPSPYETGASFAHRQKFGKFDLVAGGYYIKGQSFREGASKHYGRINANTRYRITDSMTVGLNFNFQKGNSVSYFIWDNDTTGAYKPLDGTLNANKSTRFTIDPSFTVTDKAGNRHKILSRYYRVGNDQGDRSNFSDLVYGEYQFQRHIDAIGVTATAGIVGTYSQVEAALFNNASYTGSNYSGYLQLDKKFVFQDISDNDQRGLNLSFGARYESNFLNAPDTSLTESKPVFRFGANYQAGKATYIRTSFGQGYRFPTVAEKYVTTCIGPICVYPNTSLTSETGWSVELGLKQGFQIDAWQGYVDVALFWSEYQNMMEFTFGQYGDPFAPDLGLGFASQNIGNTRVAGIDVSVVGQGLLFGKKTTLMSGYTWIDPIFNDFDSINVGANTSTKNILKYRFRHTLKADIQSELSRNFTLGFGVQYYSFMENIDRIFGEFISGLTTYREAHSNGNFVFDLRLAYKPIDNLKLSLITKNLFNKEFTIRPALMEAPMNITFRADYEF